MLATLRAPTILLAGALILAGCANLQGFGEGGQMTTASVTPQPKVDPACVILASQIDNLRREGVADRITKASLNKYKMKTADLVKVDQLTKANAEFQAKCSTIPSHMATEASATPAPAAAGTSQSPPVQTVAKATQKAPAAPAQ